MKLIICADLHIGEYRSFNNYPNQRLLDTCSVLGRLFYEADKVDGHILCCGDLIDKAVGVSTKVLNVMFDEFAECFRRHPDVKFYCISGNHDMVTRFTDDYDDSIHNILHTHFSNFIHLAGATQISKGRECLTLVGIPFFDKREHFVAKLAQYEGVRKDAQDRGNVTVLLTHQCDPATPFADIFEEDVAAYDFAFNGHIHRYKQHAYNFWTVGNPLHRNMSDVGDRKGYLVLDTESWEVYREYLNFQEFELTAPVATTTAPQASKKEFSSALVATDKETLLTEYATLENLSDNTLNTGKQSCGI